MLWALVWSQTHSCDGSRGSFCHAWLVTDTLALLKSLRIAEHFMSKELAAIECDSVDHSANVIIETKWHDSCKAFSRAWFPCLNWHRLTVENELTHPNVITNHSVEHKLRYLATRDLFSDQGMAKQNEKFIAPPLGYISILFWLQDIRKPGTLKTFEMLKSVIEMSTFIQHGCIK